MTRVALLGLATLACVSQSARAATWLVAMGADDRFHPASLTIQMGDTVTWVNKDSDDHTATSGTPNCVGDGMWGSADILPAGTFTRVFAAAGTFPYFCLHHCAMGMSAVITVGGPTAARESHWGQIKHLYR